MLNPFQIFLNVIKEKKIDKKWYKQPHEAFKNLPNSSKGDAGEEFIKRYVKILGFNVEKIDRLGGIGDLVNVKAGFTRNFLLPQGKAKVATDANKAEIEERRAEFEKLAADSLSAAEKRREAIEALSIEITAKSGTEGKLFGSIGNVDIASALTEAGVEVEKREVRLPDGPLRQAGEYEITLHLHSDVNAIAKVTIIGEEEA